MALYSRAQAVTTLHLRCLPARNWPDVAINEMLEKLVATPRNLIMSTVSGKEDL